MLAGIVSIVMSLRYFEHQDVPKQLFVEIGIAAFSAGMVGVVYDHVLRSYFLSQIKEQLNEILNADAPRLGVTHIYETRTNKSQDIDLPSLLGAAQSEILLVGLGLYTIINMHRRQLVEAIARGCTVRFLIFNLEGPNADILEQSLGDGKLVKNLKGPFDAVLSFANEHAKTGKVEARLFDLIPTFGAVGIDRHQEDGCLIIELNCYSLPGEECPSLKLQKKPGGLYHTYNQQITQMWTAGSHAPRREHSKA